MKIISVHCKQGKSPFVECLREFCTNIGIPMKLVSDSEGSQNSPPIKEFCNSYLIQRHFSEAEYQNQNPSKWGGGTIKHHLKHIHFHTNFDLRYFDYCAEHIADVHNNLLNRSIGSAVPLQVLTGVTPDISAFRIPFWKHCWYWDPHIKWLQHQWCKGHCL
jgi:hypothetical protein